MGGALSQQVLQAGGVLLLCVGLARLVSRPAPGNRILPAESIMVQAILLILLGLSALAWGYFGK